MKQCSDCGGDAGRGWTNPAQHDRCVSCACGLASFHYVPTTGEATRTTWAVDERLAHHRAYMQDWRRRRKVAQWRAILYGAKKEVRPMHDDPNFSDAILLALHQRWPDWIPRLVPRTAPAQPPPPVVKQRRKPGPAPKERERPTHRKSYPLPEGLRLAPGTYWNDMSNRIAIRVAIASKMKHVCQFPPTQAGADLAGAMSALARRLRDDGCDIDEIKARVRAAAQAVREAS